MISHVSGYDWLWELVSMGMACCGMLWVLVICYGMLLALMICCVSLQSIMGRIMLVFLSNNNIHTFNGLCTDFLSDRDHGQHARDEGVNVESLILVHHDLKS